MISLGSLNSRMKDIYDVWYLIEHFPFDFPVVTQAVSRTFDNRNTTFKSYPACFSREYIQEKQVQWKAFVRKLEREGMPFDIEPVMTRLLQFFNPVIGSITGNEGEDSITRWDPDGGWNG